MTHKNDVHIINGDQSIPEDGTLIRSSSISSQSSKSAGSSDFSFEDQYESNVNENGTNNAATTPSFLPTLETPGIQVMERPPNINGSGYRIPSSVFARNKSANPNPEWSTNSNDSLFSIHNGNMSFTTDQFTGLLIKSHELLGTHGGGACDIHKSGELPPHPSPRIVLKSSPPSETCESEERRQAFVNKPIHVVEVTNQIPDKAKEDIVKANKDEKKPEIQIKKNETTSIMMPDEVRPPTSVSSHQSNASVELSFAFQVVQENDKEKSVRSGKDLSCSDREGPNTPTSAPVTSSWTSYFSCGSSCT